MRGTLAFGVLSVAAPMAPGLAIAPALHLALAPAGIGFWPFALSLAAALSITAFSVMARILEDHGRTQTPFGRLSLATGVMMNPRWLMELVVMKIALDAGRGGRRVGQLEQPPSRVG